MESEEGQMQEKNYSPGIPGSEGHVVDGLWRWAQQR